MTVVDQYDGRVFDDYETAAAFMEGLGGFPPLMQLALDATAELPDGFVTLGFSNGAGMAEYVAASRPGVAALAMIGGALDPRAFELAWPQGLGGQVHTTVDDPWRDEGIEAVRAAAEAAGGEVEVYDYPGSGHLFADPSKADEYQPAEAALMWSRVLAYLHRIDPS